MPNSIKHYHLSINLYIDDPDDDKNRIQMLIDTGAAMNTDNL